MATGHVDFTNHGQSKTSRDCSRDGNVHVPWINLCLGSEKLPSSLIPCNGLWPALCAHLPLSPLVIVMSMNALSLRSIKVVGFLAAKS